MAEVMEPCDAEWRGLGVIPGSGMKLRAEYAAFDARKAAARNSENLGRSNPACRCGEVLQGKCRPNDCKGVRQGLHAGASGGSVHGFQRGRLLGVLSIWRNRKWIKR
jgi:hydrogenase expression/formation protein HypD